MTHASTASTTNGNGLVHKADPPISAVSRAAERLCDEFAGINLSDTQHDLLRRIGNGVSVSDAEAEVRDVLARTDEFVEEGSLEDLTPIPIPALPEVPKLDLLIFPGALREYVADCAKRRASPVEYVAVAALSGLGSVIGTKVGVQPKQNDGDFFLFPNLYSLIIAPSGTKKTDSIKDGLRFVEEIERDAWDEYQIRRPEIDAAAIDRKLEMEAIESQIKGIYAGKAQKKDAAIVDRELLKQRLSQLKAVTPETAKRLIIQDSTIEKTGILLNENPNGLLAYHDEISPLLDELGHKEKQRDRGFYLRAANGTGTEKIDRVGREDLHVNNLCLTVIGGTQPARIGALAESTVKKDGDDGLLPRFGAAVWPDVPEYHYVDTAPLGVSEARGIFRALHSLDPSRYGIKRLRDEDGGHYFMTFSAEAQTFFTAWLINHQKETRGAFGTNGTDIPASHYSKYSGLMPKLALIFQLVDCVSGVDTGIDISLKNAEMAAEWIEFFKAHAVRLYARTMKPEFRRAKAIIERIQKDELPRIFSARDIYRNHWKDLSDRKEVMTAIEVLVDYQWLRILKQETGGKHATRYVFTDL